MAIRLLSKQILCPFCFEDIAPYRRVVSVQEHQPKECPEELDKAYSQHMGRSYTLRKAVPATEAGILGA